MLVLKNTGHEKTALEKIITSSEMGALPVAVCTSLPPNTLLILLKTSLS